MAKTESTAVNDLIKIATTQTPLRQDPTDDLMFAVPSKKDRRTKQHALAPRGTDVPLPRARAPHGTQQNEIAMPAIKAADAAASPAPRTTTSSPAVAPPPLPRASSAGIAPPPLPRTTTSLAAISPPPLPRAATSSAAIAPPPLPRAATSLAAVTPPPVPKAALSPAIATTLDAPAPSTTAPEFLSDSFEALATSTENPSLASMDSIPTSPAVAAIEPIRARATSPSLTSEEPIATRTTRPSLPSPMRTPLPPAARIPMPSEYPIVSAVHSQPMAPAPQPTLDEIEPVWTEDSLDVDVERFRADSTAQVPKPRTTLEWMIKLAPLAGAMILLGVFVGGYLVFDGQGGKRRTAAAAADTVAAEGTVEVKVVADEAEPVAVAVAAPATPPNLATTEPAAAVPVTPPNLAAATTIDVANPAAPTATAPITAPTTPSITTPAPTATAIARHTTLVDIRIDSKPTGATVMLVDGGKQTFLGTTPISTAVDPSRSYDVAFSHPRRPTQTVHLDPKLGTRLAVVLGRSGTPSTRTELAKPAPIAPAAKLIATPVAPKAVATAKAPVATAAPVTKLAKPAKAPTAKIAEPAWDAQIEKAAAPATDKAVGGTGTLMISSKPPCEIHVDGKSTGLMTPQRSLSLPAGKHKITLINPTQKIKKSVAVEITANESTKVIQDLTDLMK